VKDWQQAVTWAKFAFWSDEKIEDFFVLRPCRIRFLVEFQGYQFLIGNGLAYSRFNS
jgi:hypothetical protein